MAHKVAKKYSFNDLVSKMTNHENTLWSRAGYPGLHKKEIKKLLPYAGAAKGRMLRGYTILSER